MGVQSNQTGGLKPALYLLLTVSVTCTLILFFLLLLLLLFFFCKLSIYEVRWLVATYVFVKIDCL